MTEASARPPGPSYARGRLDPDALNIAIALGREQRHIEFKGPGPRTDRLLCAKVVRAVLALSNTADGGAVVVGVKEHGDGHFEGVGLTPSDLASWRADHTHDSIRNYADPDPQVAVDVIPLDGLHYVVLSVSQFADLPVICSKSWLVGKDLILKQGACYIRPRLKPESAEVSTAAEMRELLDMATERALARYLATAHRVGAIVRRSAPDDDALFAAELGELG